MFTEDARLTSALQVIMDAGLCLIGAVVICMQGCMCRVHRDMEHDENAAVYNRLFDGCRSCFHNDKSPTGRLKREGWEGEAHRVEQGGWDEGKKTQGEEWGYKPWGRVVVKAKRDRQSKGSGGIVKDPREGWSFELWRRGPNFFKDERE